MRTIARLHAARREDIGDLVTWSPLPGAGLDQVDPFLLLNHHGPQVYPPGNGGLPFGPHPHRGFETVTFIVQGELTHGDSGGHRSTIREGGVQWMTAGSGLVHSEVSSPQFQRDGGPLEILQLWVNLPPALKMTPPRYVGLQRGDIPAIPLPGGGALNLVAGDWDGRQGPVDSISGVFMATVELPAGGRVIVPGIAGRNVFLYVVRGAIRIAGGEAVERTLVELAPGGDSVAIVAARDALLLLGHARPIGAPVVAHGPFVMNTREEILEAIRDYQAGKLG